MTLQTYPAVGTSGITNMNTPKQQKPEEASSEMKRFGSSPEEKLCIFTGTVEKLIQWNKILTKNLYYYEVIATMVSLREGKVRTQKIMLLRNRSGPVLQVVYYTVTHIDLEDFYLDKIVRCVGYMSGHNVLNAFSIRGATQEEVDNLERFTLISDQSVSLQLKK
ncbi:uncharacterized protein LOC130443958 [Diorhabda sublineata]|uniref:uncharacterized protein LOC130443958 n=1 Tax=Diorhabda sublineata TaxID=1163346 RepID=UPI0024E0B653|nr:uncharacterized protein LOC130443958 [Diorhabda sublineata]